MFNTTSTEYNMNFTQPLKKNSKSDSFFFGEGRRRRTSRQADIEACEMENSSEGRLRLEEPPGARLVPAGHTPFSWLQQGADARVPIGHTPFSWGAARADVPAEAQDAASARDARGAVPGQVGRKDRVVSPRDQAGNVHTLCDWPPPPGAVLQCSVGFPVGTADWSAQAAVGEAVNCACTESAAQYGPHHFQSRKIFTLVDRGAGIALIGRRDFRDDAAEMWWLHVAAVGMGRLQFYLQSASSQGYLCSSDKGVVTVSGTKTRSCLWHMPVQALRPTAGFPCKVSSVEHERYLSLMVPRDAVPSGPGQLAPIMEARPPPPERLRGHPVLRTTVDRLKSCELVFNG